MRRVAKIGFVSDREEVVETNGAAVHARRPTGGVAVDARAVAEFGSKQDSRTSSTELML